MNTIGAVVGGVLGGILGAALWAGITYFTGYEVGYVAWLVGLFVGFGVSRGAGGGLDATSGVLAVVITVLALGFGKYATAYFAVEKWIDEDGLSAADTSDEVLISELADVIAMERGVEIEWPEEETSLRDAYPHDLWLEAEARWNGASASEQTGMREAFRERQASYLDEIRGEVRLETLKGSFSPIDLIFLALAIGTAWKMARGDGEREAEAA